MGGVWSLRKGWRIKESSSWNQKHMKQKAERIVEVILGEKKKKKVTEYPISLMVKLGWDQTKGDTAFATLAAYEGVIEKKGSVWFGTNALASGIARKRRQEFLNAISNKKQVHMYFIVGKTGGGTNKIEYKAEVVSLESKKGGMACPESSLTPSEYSNQKCSIWIKMKNLQPCMDQSVSDFKFANNDKLLKQALNSTCCFGYITNLHAKH